MRQVPDTYYAYRDSRRVDIRIAFKLVDTSAAGNAAITSSGAEPGSSLADILTEGGRSGGKWMTMEDDLVQTDGTWRVMPKSAYMGFWSTAISDGTGAFTSPPTVTATLSAPASSIGFTLTFDDKVNCWPTEIQISAYSGSTLLAQETFQNAGAFFVADMPVSRYDKVEFRFLRTQPYRRVKLYELLFGVVQRFDKDTIVKAVFKEGASAACENLPSRELVFTFDNSDHKYNLINPNGLYAYLQDGQEITSAISIDGDSVSMGIHHYTKAKAQDGALTAEITANDRVYWLDKDTYDGGTTGTWTLEAALTAVLPGVTLDISDDLKARTVGKCIPLETTKREAVRLLAQAARCSCWIGRDGAFVFRELTVGSPADTLDEDNMEALDGVSVAEKVDTVKLTVKNDFAGTETEYISGEGENVWQVSNPCAYSGQAVADWLLAVRQRRLQYECRSRGNPAVELGDTVTIYNAYDEAGDSAIYDQTITYDGGLSAVTKALGEAWT